MNLRVPYTAGNILDRQGGMLAAQEGVCCMAVVSCAMKLYGAVLTLRWMDSFKPRPPYLTWLRGCQGRSGSLGDETLAGNRAPIPSPSSSSKSEGFPLSLPRKKQRNSELFAVPRRTGFELTLRHDTDCMMSQQWHVTADTSEVRSCR